MSLHRFGASKVLPVIRVFINTEIWTACMNPALPPEAFVLFMTRRATAPMTHPPAGSRPIHWQVAAPFPTGLDILAAGRHMAGERKDSFAAIQDSDQCCSLAEAPRSGAERPYTMSLNSSLTQVVEAVRPSLRRRTAAPYLSARYVTFPLTQVVEAPYLSMRCLTLPHTSVARVVGAVKSSLRGREAAPTSPRLCIDFPGAHSPETIYRLPASGLPAILTAHAPRSSAHSAETMYRVPRSGAHSPEAMYRVPASGLTSMRFIFLAALKAPRRRIAFPRAAYDLGFSQRRVTSQWIFPAQHLDSILHSIPPDPDMPGTHNLRRRRTETMYRRPANWELRLGCVAAGTSSFQVNQGCPDTLAIIPISRVQQLQVS
ncbi:hypothetical protein B0H11DRAFT_1914684 [Mycena galericulata]|nr:hypothetical protein B0H11DRAFT_1914684 [Mycena galericulata]